MVAPKGMTFGCSIFYFPPVLWLWYTSVSAAPVPHPVAMTLIVCSPAYRTTHCVSCCRHCFLKSSQQICHSTRDRTYTCQCIIYIQQTRMSAFFSCLQHDFMDKASSACTTNEMTSLHTRGTDLQPRVCAAVIVARLLAKSQSHCSQKA